MPNYYLVIKMFWNLAKNKAKGKKLVTSHPKPYYVYRNENGKMVRKKAFCQRGVDRKNWCVLEMGKMVKWCWRWVWRWCWSWSWRWVKLIFRNPEERSFRNPEKRKLCHSQVVKLGTFLPNLTTRATATAWESLL